MTQIDVNATLKEAAARAAVARIEPGMVVGLGTGSTAAYAIKAIGERIAANWRITGIATSVATAKLAASVGIPLGDLNDYRKIDITIDGADQIADGSLDLIKGLGGALLREKMIALASRELIIVADATKRVVRLGQNGPVPVEIVPFGWQRTVDCLTALGLAPILRGSPHTPFITDGGNYILDCDIAETAQAGELARAIKLTSGVIESGFFIGLTSAAVIANETGVVWFYPDKSP